MDSASSCTEELETDAALRVRGGSGGGIRGVFEGRVTGSEKVEVGLDVTGEESDSSVGLRGGRIGLILGPNMSFVGLVSCVRSLSLPPVSSLGGVERGLMIFSPTGVPTSPLRSSGLKERRNGDSLLPINLDLVGVSVPVAGIPKADPSPALRKLNRSERFVFDSAFLNSPLPLPNAVRGGEKRLILAGSSFEMPVPAPRPSDRGLKASADRRVERNRGRGGWRVDVASLVLAFVSSGSDGAV
jgi:hypothetical protein